MLTLLWKALLTAMLCSDTFLYRSSVTSSDFDTTMLRYNTVAQQPSCTE